MNTTKKPPWGKLRVVFRCAVGLASLRLVRLWRKPNEYFLCLYCTKLAPIFKTK